MQRQAGCGIYLCGIDRQGHGLARLRKECVVILESLLDNPAQLL
jgi:hypothetical protein